MNVIYHIYHFVFFVICACILLLQKSIHFNLIETEKRRKKNQLSSEVAATAGTAADSDAADVAAGTGA